MAREIQIRLTPQQEADLTRVRHVNAEAFDAYLEGRFFLGPGRQRRSEQGHKFLPAGDQTGFQICAGLGRFVSGPLSRSRKRFCSPCFVPLKEGEERRQAREAVEQALELDPNLAEAHAQIGRIQMFVDWDWTGANASLQRALALDPGNSGVVTFASSLAASLGRFEEALELAHRAIALNAVSRGLLAQICFAMGRQEEAEVDFTKTIELNPNLDGNHGWLGFVYLAEGRALDALAEIEREPMNFARLQGYAVVYYALGRTKDSDTALRELIVKYQTDSSFQIAGVYAFRHEPDQAFEWLERAYVQHDTGLANTRFDPLRKNVRGDPRYAAFLKKVNLPL